MYIARPTTFSVNKDKPTQMQMEYGGAWFVCAN